MVETLKVNPEALIVEIEKISKRAIHPDLPYFRQCYLKCFNTGCGELRYIRASLYFYSLFCECGAKPVRFCANQTLLQKYSIGEPKETLSIIHALRTQIAHSLDPTGNDLDLLENASAWFRRHTGQDLPTTDAQWVWCHHQIVYMGMDLLKSIKCFLGEIETDSEMAEMRAALRQTIEGGIDRVTIEQIAFEVLTEQRRDDISPGAFCDRNLSDWNKILSIKSSKTDMRHEARALIERTISNIPPTSPFNTLEMITMLNIPRGHLVGKLVRERDRLLEAGILNRDELLTQLTDYLQTLQSPPPSNSST